MAAGPNPWAVALSVAASHLARPRTLRFDHGAGSPWTDILLGALMAGALVACVALVALWLSSRGGRPTRRGLR